MTKIFLFLCLVLAAVLPLSASGKEGGATCDKSAPDSEFSWNPKNAAYVTTRLARFYNLDGEIESAYETGNFVLMRSLADENLELAGVYRCNWNYGNAIHDSNRFLGLASLKEGDVNKAVGYLLKSGKSPGSPQLNSFGPELDLANELLKRGKRDAVVTYLGDIQSFWKMDRGVIDEWLEKINKGETPELKRFASVQPGTVEIILMWFLTLLPLLATLGALCWKRREISRKWLFAAISVLAGYIVVVPAGAAVGAIFMYFVESVWLASAFVYIFSGVVIAAQLAVLYCTLRYFLRVRQTNS